MIEVGTRDIKWRKNERREQNTCRKVIRDSLNQCALDLLYSHALLSTLVVLMSSFIFIDTKWELKANVKYKRLESKKPRPFMQWIIPNWFFFASEYYIFEKYVKGFIFDKFVLICNSHHGRLKSRVSNLIEPEVCFYVIGTRQFRICSMNKFYENASQVDTSTKWRTKKKNWWTNWHIWPNAVYLTEW